MTKKKWRLAAFAAAILVCLGSTACSASKSESDYAGAARSYETTEAYYDDNEAYSTMDTAKSDDTSAAEFDDKIIRTADVYMESEDAQRCYDTLLQFAKDNGGSEMNVKKSHDSYGNYEYFNIDATLKISPDKLEDFIALAEKTDKVTSSQISADDVTQEYYDIKLRLDSKKASLKNYYKLLDEAETVQDSLEIQRYITDLTAEIESMEGMLKYYDARVDLSTINLSIQQRDKLDTEIDDDFHWDSLSFRDVGRLMKKGFLGVLNFLWMLIVWVFIIVVALSPILLIALGVFLIVRACQKKKKKINQDSTVEQNN